MRIYLDTCCLQRPLDDRSQLRVDLESESILAVLAMCDHDDVEIVSSEILQIETERNPHPQRRAYVTEILDAASAFVVIDGGIVARAKTLENAGFKGMDALHLAAAEAADVRYFCSCDDRLVKRAKSLDGIHIAVVTPLELVEEIVE